MKLLFFSYPLLTLLLNGLLLQQQSTQEYYIDNDLNDTVYYNADIMPKYKSGDMDFFFELLHETNGTGHGSDMCKTILISFIVTKNGTPVKCRIENCGYNQILDFYANKVATAVEGMTGWKSGSINGNPVNVYIRKKLYLHFQ